MIVLENKSSCERDEAERSVRTSSCSIPQPRLKCLRRRARQLCRRFGNRCDRTSSQFEIITGRTFSVRVVKNHACRTHRRIESEGLREDGARRRSLDRGPTKLRQGRCPGRPTSRATAMLPFCWLTRPWSTPYVRCKSCQHGGLSGGHYCDQKCPIQQKILPIHRRLKILPALTQHPTNPKATKLSLLGKPIATSEHVKRCRTIP
jgi:hypothetical protein